MADLDDLTVGMVNDMFIEKANDDYDWKELATQEDMDKFQEELWQVQELRALPSRLVAIPQS